MIPLTPGEERAIRRAASDPLTFASRLSPSLWIAGRDYTALAREWRYSAEDPAGGSPAVVLEAEIAARLPEDLEQEPCEVLFAIDPPDGPEVVAFRGDVVAVDTTTQATELLGATPGHYAAVTPLGTDTEYADAAPSQALYEAAAALPYTGARIDHLAKPLFTRLFLDDQHFRWWNTVSEVWEAVRSDAGLASCDTPLSEAGGFLVEAAPRGESAWVFREGADIREGDLSVSSPEGRYAEVVCYRETDGPGAAARVAVDNGGRRVPRGAALLISMADDDPESPYERAFREARALSYDRALEWKTVYPPFHLTRGDVVTVYGAEITPAGTLVREYRARITQVRMGPRSADFAARGELRSTELVPRSRPRISRRSARKAPLGTDYLGEPYISTSLSWAAEEEKSVVLYAEGAEEAGVLLYDDPTVPDALVIDY